MTSFKKTYLNNVIERILNIKAELEHLGLVFLLAGFIWVNQLIPKDSPSLYLTCSAHFVKLFKDSRQMFKRHGFYRQTGSNPGFINN